MRTHDITLRPMTPEMYHAFFREYQNDPALSADPADFTEYHYDPERTERYIRRVQEKQRIPLAILLGEDIAGEILFKDIVPNVSAVLSITLKNDCCKNHGIGTKAEQLAIDYAFRQLNLQTLYADALITNTRSSHVLEKVGFQFIHEENNFRYYRIDNQK